MCKNISSTFIFCLPKSFEVQKSSHFDSYWLKSSLSTIIAKAVFWNNITFKVFFLREVEGRDQISRYFLRRRKISADLNYFLYFRELLRPILECFCTNFYFYKKCLLCKNKTLQNYYITFWRVRTLCGGESLKIMAMKCFT